MRAENDPSSDWSGLRSVPTERAREPALAPEQLLRPVDAPAPHSQLLPRPPDRLDRLKTAAGLELAPIVLGTASIGSVSPVGPWSANERRRAFRLFDDIFDAGCRAFDLARSYALGGSERVFGEWLRASGVREQVFVTTKIGHPLPFFPNRLGTDALDEDLEASLRALGLEQLDALLLHRDHPHASLEHVGMNLLRYKSSGRARYVGVSNWRFDRIAALNRVMGAELVDVASPQLSLAEWTAPIWAGSCSISGRKHRYERRQYKAAQLPTFAYCPLGRGFFGHRPPWLGRHRGFQSALNAQRLHRVKRLAAKRGATPAQIALAYLWSQPFPVFPVVGVSRPEHMKENLAAAGIALDETELRWLEGGYPNG